jgi:2-polyprenyl-3-methyl-5-hydroxy-6-metoxy-1,4-benzoquinol methylase
VIDPADGREIVREGYNALSHCYRSDDADDGEYGPWIATLLERLPARASVLDLGCGCGVPVARALAAAGHQVTGVDISDVQIERARTLVPDATLLRADATEVDFAPASFHAVVCLYALIHLPLVEQPALIKRIRTWLRPSGLVLGTVGADAWTGTTVGWLGGATAMWWSQADAGTYRRWFDQAGLTITEHRFVPDGDSGHSLVWARVRDDPEAFRERHITSFHDSRPLSPPS